MTNAELKAAEQARRKSERRVRFEQGINSPVGRTGRQRNKKAFHKGGRSSWKRDI